MANGISHKINGLEVMRGNKKLAKDTLIFNMGSATTCPSRALGMCKLCKECYALKAEIIYPACKPYRDRQERYWKESSIEKIIGDFDELLTTKKTFINGKLRPLHEKVKWFRFNESGDFHKQTCVEKLDAIAKHLMKNYNIRTYGYTARKDLDFSRVSFLVKGSGHGNGKDGQTIARENVNHEVSTVYNENGTKFHVCPMDCRECNLCKVGKKNIVFPLH